MLQIPSIGRIFCGEPLHTADQVRGRLSPENAVECQSLRQHPCHRQAIYFRISAADTIGFWIRKSVAAAPVALEIGGSDEIFAPTVSVFGGGRCSFTGRLAPCLRAILSDAANTSHRAVTARGCG